MSLEQIARKLQAEVEHWEALLEKIGPERMELPGVNGEWTMKDLIAHHTGWNRRTVGQMLAAQRGEPRPPRPWPTDLKTEDAVNAYFFDANRARPLEDVLAEARQQMQQVLELLQSLPDDTRIEQGENGADLIWIGQTRFEPGEIFSHFHDEHEADVRAWLARNGG